MCISILFHLSKAEKRLKKSKPNTTNVSFERSWGILSLIFFMKNISDDNYEYTFKMYHIYSPITEYYVMTQFFTSYKFYDCHVSN